MNERNGTCGLCGTDAELQLSHTIPKFLYKWLKRTSITGYMRKPVSPNKRTQDGHKDYLLCKDCENLLSKDEKYFADNIFYVFCEEELDDNYFQTGNIKEIAYHEDFLRFIAGINFRHVISMSDETKNSVGKKYLSILNENAEIWKDYLLQNRVDTGTTRSYLLFLQSLASAKSNSTFPEGINPRINHYLIRGIDGTVITGNNTLGIYLKLGPIVIYTSVLPKERKLMKEQMIHKNGKISTVQNLRDSDINNFVFITRPNEAYKLYDSQISKKQIDVIGETLIQAVEKNPQKAEWLVADYLFKKRIEEQDETIR